MQAGSSQGARRPGLLALAAAGWLSGCAINPALELSEVPGNAPEAVVLQAPFFPQAENQCGPAALATVLVASGVDIGPEQLAPQVFLPTREGSLQLELVAATRRTGRVAFLPGPRVEFLLAELAAGRPVLVLQNLGTRSIPVWHYAVLVGYDRSRNAFQLNSGEDRGRWMPAPKLLRTWDWGGRWALVPLPPGDLPARTGYPAESSSEVDRFLQSVADFEAIAGAAAALPSWQAAARQWPDRPGPALALGNHAYHEARLPEAARWYARGLENDPFNPALANNLATVLGEAGCARQGEAVLLPVARQVDPESVWAAAVAATLEELAVQRGADPAFCEDLADAP
jgi:hypothetical protein